MSHSTFTIRDLEDAIVDLARRSNQPLTAREIRTGVSSAVWRSVWWTLLRKKFIRTGAFVPCDGTMRDRRYRWCPEEERPPTRERESRSQGARIERELRQIRETIMKLSERFEVALKTVSDGLGDVQTGLADVQGAHEGLSADITALKTAIEEAGLPAALVAQAEELASRAASLGMSVKDMGEKLKTLDAATSGVTVPDEPTDPGDEPIGG